MNLKDNDRQTDKGLEEIRIIELKSGCRVRREKTLQEKQTDGLRVVWKSEYSSLRKKYSR